MRTSRVTCAAVAAAVVLTGCVASATASTTVYDSGGFESPTFTSGPLTGQVGGLWVESGGAAAGAATVEAGAAQAGSQAVAVTRTGSVAAGGDKRYWPNLSPVTPTAAQNVVTVDWDMDVAANSTAGVATGPFFGIEAYGPNDALIAAAGVDATTGEVLFADPALGGGFNNTAADNTVALGGWNHYTLLMDFTTDTAVVSVNGTPEQVVPGFDSAGVTAFSDADLSAVATAPEPATQSGTALFDNYVVANTGPAAVPEPASMAGVAMAGLSLGRRRARRGGAIAD